MLLRMRMSVLESGNFGERSKSNPCRWMSILAGWSRCHCSRNHTVCTVFFFSSSEIFQLSLKSQIINKFYPVSTRKYYNSKKIPIFRVFSAASAHRQYRGHGDDCANGEKGGNAFSRVGNRNGKGRGIDRAIQRVQQGHLVIWNFF